MFGQWGRRERGEGGKEKKGNSTVIHNVKLGKLGRKKIQDLMECASTEN